MAKILKKPKKLLVLLAIVAGLSFGLVNLQSAVINVSAVLHPIMFVAPAEMEFGMSFPQEVRTAEFVVVGKWSYPEEINYKITQEHKPIWPEPAECGQDFDFVEEAQEYCQQNPTDYDCCYPSICPYLYKISEEDEGDTHNHARLNPIGGEDLVDYWLVEFHVPTIRGYVGQDYVGEPIDFPGLYGCDVKIAFAQGTYCGDGIKQSPNDYGIGGPADDGYEDCDGESGVPEGYRCTAECVLEGNSPICTDNDTQACNTGLPGVCAGGTQTCDESSHWGICVQNTPSVTEFCDGLDNDCDGVVDEDGVCQTECSPPGTTQACNTGALGLCSAGTQTCSQFGTWDICVQNQPPTQEVCNGLDDDCDGLTDEGGVCTSPECTPNNTQACNTGLQGLCSAGTQTCDSQGAWGTCIQNQSPITEVCDGLDNDCDGTMDEGGVCGSGGECTPLTTQACNTGLVGVCAAGTQTCSQLGNWGSCVQDNPATTEVCDGVDNNCDGSVDEENVCSGGGGGGGGGSGGSFIALFVHTPSLILTTDPTTVTITWFTNRLATSRVVYDTIPHPVPGTPPNYGYQWSTATYDNSPKVTFHSVTITGLIPNTTYYFRPISAASPEVYGTELTFTTGQSGEGSGGEPPSPTPTPPLTPPVMTPPVVGTPPPTPPETGGTVAGVEYEDTQDTAGQVLGEEVGEKVRPPVSNPPVAPAVPQPEKDCRVSIILLLILNLLILAILAYKESVNEIKWQKYCWLAGLLLAGVPSIIWYPVCWLQIYLLVTLIIFIICLVLPKKAKQSNIE